MLIMQRTKWGMTVETRYRQVDNPIKWLATRERVEREISERKPSFYDRNWKWLDLAVIIAGFCLIDFAARWVMR